MALSPLGLALLESQSGATPGGQPSPAMASMPPQFNQSMPPPFNPAVQQPPLVQNPPSPPRSQVAPTDVTGAFKLSTDAANTQYLAQLQRQNAMWGGLAGLGSAGIIGAPKLLPMLGKGASSAALGMTPYSTAADAGWGSGMLGSGGFNFMDAAAAPAAADAGTSVAGALGADALGAGAADAGAGAALAGGGDFLSTILPFLFLA